MAKGEGGTEGAAPPFVRADAIDLGERNAAGAAARGSAAAMIGRPTTR